MKRNKHSKELGTPVACKNDSSNCSTNEYCKIVDSKAGIGFCECKEGFQKLGSQECHSIELSAATLISNTSSYTNSIPVPTLPQKQSTNKDIEHSTTSPISSTLNSETLSTTLAPTPQEVKKLIVNINNKTITLPRNSTKYKDWVTLSAYAIGETGKKFEYSWTLIEKPETKVEGTIKDMKSQTVSLSNLVTGVYIFKVSVKGDNSYGEATGNVTILPEKFKNKPPKAVIVQPNQVVKLPNSGIILDGGGSTDDKKVVSYEWELLMGPIGYKLSESTGPTLQLTKLIPGNYTVMLKVKDEEGLEGNATASVLIIEETDYPPTANAGGDKIIYLPQTTLTLNGNTSTDDHDIKEWEWTKGPEDSGKAVDMQNTRTPFLSLSNLEVGHYHFILKVTDTAKQSSKSSAHVYVHASSDNVLQANAGKNQSLTVPVTKITLDGSKSTGVTKETKITWKQISGPTQATFSSRDRIKSDVTSVTKGIYVFQLFLQEPKTLRNSTSNVTVSVIQEKNVAPVANAGSDLSVVLPTSVVMVNGSLSADDVGIAKWRWIRDPNSLAAGHVVGKSDVSPILLITDVVPGQYVWNLTVWDDQGLSSTDSVSIIVKEEPNRMDHVEIIIGVDIEFLSQGQLEVFLQKIQIMLHNSTSDVILSLLKISGERLTGTVKLQLIGKTAGGTISGVRLISELRSKTSSNIGDKILNLPIVSMDTVVCQNNCSGHGECLQATRECRCKSWWMESFFKRHVKGVPNCDWSVIYVFVVAAVMMLVTILVAWALYSSLVNRVAKLTKKRGRNRYSRIDNTASRVRGIPEITNSLLDTESDSESGDEVVYEKRNSKSRNRNKNSIKLLKIRS